MLWFKLLWRLWSRLHIIHVMATRTHVTNRIKETNLKHCVRFVFEHCLKCSEPDPSQSTLKSPAVWTYSLNAHFHDSHSLSHDQYPIKHSLSQLETKGIHTVWQNCHHVQKKRNIQGKKVIQLVISNAHHYSVPE